MGVEFTSSIAEEFAGGILIRSDMIVVEKEATTYTTQRARFYEFLRLSVVQFKLNRRSRGR